MKKYYKLLNDGRVVGVSTYRSTAFECIEITEEEFEKFNFVREKETETEDKKQEILTKLKEIDEKSIRALRNNEQYRLDTLEAQAVELREKLKAI